MYGVWIVSPLTSRSLEKNRVARRVILLSRGFCSLKSGWWVTVVGRMLAEIKTGSVVTGVWPRGYGNSPGRNRVTHYGR
jgi:hypothetical protein